MISLFVNGHSDSMFLYSLAIPQQCDCYADFTSAISEGEKELEKIMNMMM